MTFEQWEKICRQCGRCCYEKIQYDDGSIYFTDVPCEHLDTETKKCRIYGPNRTKIYPGCIQLTPEIVCTMPLLPVDCEYIKWLKLKR